MTLPEINLNQQGEAQKAPESWNTRAVFSEGKSDATRFLEKTSDSIRTELATLRGLQNMNPTPEREQQIFNLERKRKRSMSFALLQTKGTGTEEQKMEQKKVLEGKETMEKLKASDILLLKKKWVDLANLLLVPKNDPTASVSRDILKESESFIVNFGENKNINHIIGAGDILPPTVSQVRINGIEGERKYDPRPGYYELKTGKYLPIFDGDTVEVMKISTLKKEELESANKADEEQLNHIAQEDIREESVRKISLEEKKSFMNNATILAKAVEEQYGIPWQVIVGQAALESGYGKSWLAKDGNYFGIKGTGKIYATREVYNGKDIMENASFRTYSDIKESFIDHAKFLAIQNPRYRKAFQYAQDITPRPSYYPEDYNKENYSPRMFLEAIKEAGYATDDTYVDKIASVWKTNDIEVA